MKAVPGIKKNYPVTKKSVVFQSCQVAIRMTGAGQYDLVIIDPHENTEYHFMFGEDVKATLIKEMTGGIVLPPMGGNGG